MQCVALTAFYAFATAAVPVSRDELLRTRDYMITRGPDAAGEWLSPDSRIGLGHRRLAIIDLSPAGQQPMSRDGRYWIVFNGEIYNYQELREELEQLGMTFHSHSDTEVILALYAQLGVDMLAFAGHVRDRHLGCPERNTPPGARPIRD